ncbi:hypothetical protein P170DRAFT_475660 [Aspergillus steynii IBT 23096]|uniref:Uncharacterized protein n=1 Tax=Aspergillus steynii IBT 23096 TaxID=1392250 RepID=A0A2I2G947_9EURO|nr:uncharacterized protein P170DRAFT_475660 [Aspergillus steynii IBT 23096]PLB49363.1 hypothetical protein P170DRAFT_475660 [Aspergillus steynii IBT 23096]
MISADPDDDSPTSRVLLVEQIQDQELDISDEGCSPCSCRAGNVSTALGNAHVDHLASPATVWMHTLLQRGQSTASVEDGMVSDILVYSLLRWMSLAAITPDTPSTLHNGVLAGRFKDAKRPGYRPDRTNLLEANPGFMQCALTNDVAKLPDWQWSARASRQRQDPLIDL